MEVQVKGKSYPCRLTMGAMLRFKELTGREVSDIASDGLTDMVKFIFCCTVSACKADGVELGMSLEDFADSIDSADMIRINEALNSESVTSPTDPKKKMTE